MKIALWHNLGSGGAKRALYYHVKGLLERGHTLEAWCPPTADRTYLPLADLIPEHVVPLHWQQKTTGSTLLRPYTSYKNIFGRYKAMHQHCQQCAAEIAQGGFDILLVNPCRFYHVSPLSRYTRIPTILYLQEPYRLLYEAMPQLPWLAIDPPQKGWWGPGHIKKFLRNAISVQALRIQAREEATNAQAYQTILANSLYSRESILRAYGLDAKVCYLGVDTDIFQRQNKPREDFLIGLGSFSWKKNVKFVIEALQYVKKPRPKLIWIGDFNTHSYLEALQQLAQSLQVDFEPKLRVSDQELVDLLNRACMMVYAPRLEPFGLAPLEANACGLPVIAIAEGGVRESIIDGVNGLLVESDPFKMAQAIDQLNSNPEIATTLGANGHRLVQERWTLQLATDRIEQRLLESLATYGTLGNHHQ